ncbi:MAG: LD-carboxypeptidase [bacterium]|nr:LD-carboxypeptidase [bacterium]
MKQFISLPKLKKGDQVAVISPSAGLPGLFPWVQDLGLERIQNVFRLIPNEYPTTRQMNAPLQDRARDIMEAFKDPANKAVIASIGGEDQIKLLKYLDPQVFLDNPKPFFGYSDNTHLHNFLWKLGIPSYYGGSIMTQYAMQGGMHDFTVEYLKKALFEGGEVELKASKEFNDEGLDWSVKENLNKQRKMEPNDGWQWDGNKDAEGILWGGCIESLIEEFTVGKYLPSNDDLTGTVLFLESAEDIPDPWIVEYLLTGMGERGWFDKFQAVLVGRPKAWEFDKQKTAEEKVAYRKTQREVVLKTIRQYNKQIPIIQNLDFGHTDPQIVLPMGQTAMIDSTNKKITLSY